MIHAYPYDLARFVRERWNAPDCAMANTPAIPPGDQLERLLSVSYQASLLREEERPVTFRLMLGASELHSASDGPPGGLHRLTFERPRELDEHEVRRLSPAAKFHRTLIGVAPDEDADHTLKIWGLLHSGPRWLRAVNGGRGAIPRMPPLLTVSVTGPGRVVVSRGEHTIARLAAGAVTGPSLDVFDSRWLPALFADVRHELWELHQAARAEAGGRWAELDTDVARMIGQHLIRRIVSTIRLAHHGGMIVFVEPSAAPDVLAGRGHIALKYRFREDEPRQRFRTLIVKIMNTLASGWAEGGGRVGWEQYNRSRDPLLGEFDEAVFELAHLMAALADVDGALVITKRFELLGFGGEISGDLADVTHVQHVLDEEGAVRTEEATDGVGTRHRSAYRLCASLDHALAIVVSQDGGVRFVRRLDGRVAYWDQVATGPLEI